MSAELRAAYLDAIGLPVYVPRYVLPGAAPSPQGDYPRAVPAAVEAVATGPAPPVSESGNAPQPEARAGLDHRDARRELGMLTRDDSGGPQARPQPGAAAVPAPGGASEQAPPRFSASVIDSGMGIRFLADCSAGELAPPAKRLVANIARAMARHWQCEAALGLSASTFDWPLVKVPGLLRGEGEAREALTAHLLAAVQDAPATQLVVVFGDSLSRFIDANYLAAHSAQLLSAPDLQILLDQPAQKAPLWSALKAVQNGG